MSLSRLYLGPAAEADIPDVAIGRAIHAIPTVAAPGKSLVSLKGKPKVVFLIGAGHTGKSVLARVIAERTLARDPESTTVLAAVDPGERSLTHYFPGRVSQPDTRADAAVARWLESMINHCAQAQCSAIVDLGGGNDSLGILSTQFDLCQMMMEGGIEPVALYLFSPRLDDLEQLATLEMAGFQPRALGLICNDALGEVAVDYAERFRPLMRQSVFVRAAERGVVVRMPRLQYAGPTIEMHRLSFADAARDPQDDEAPKLDATTRARVRFWLVEMDKAFAPMTAAEWFP